MPTIPTYDAQAQLDPDARGMPRAHYDTSEFTAAAQQGRALQGLGGALEAAGQQAQQFAERAQQKAEQQNTFLTGLQSRGLDTDLQGFLNEPGNAMPVNGTGFANNFLAQADELARKRFDQMPEGPARTRAIQEWDAYGREHWGTQAAIAEHKQAGSFSTFQIGQMQDADMNSVSANPAQANTLLEAARTQIMNADGLSDTQKLQALSDYRRNVLGVEAQTLYGTDGAAMRTAFGMAPVGSPNATFSRMIGVESGGDPNAISPKGALGVAQLMPGTARDVASDLGLTNIAHMSDGQLQSYFASHPDMNARLGQAYFGQMLKKFGGDQEAAVVAYNAGPGVAADWLRKGKDDDVLPKETIDYKAKVLGPDGGASHAMTTTSPIIGRVGFDGDTATINGKSFSQPVRAVQVASQFVGMDEKANRDTLAAFIEKSCGQKVDPSKIPWCASFTDAVLGASGHPTLGSARAADFLNYGTPTSAPSEGDVVVLKSTLAGISGHVGIVQKVEGGRVYYIGGNSDNKVKAESDPLSQVAGFRHPPEAKDADAGGGTGVFSSRYAALTFADRQRLIAGADAGQRHMEANQQQQFKLDSYNTQRAVDDDVKSLTATGQGVSDLDPNRVASVLGPQKYQQWQEDRAQALDTFKGAAGMENLSADAINEQVEHLRPGPDDAGEGFSRRQNVYDAVQKQAQAILKARADDPAAVSDKAPAVQASHAGAVANPTDLTQWQPIAAARMAHQASLGIPEGNRHPITKAEAIQVMAPVNNTPAGLDGPAMKEAIGRLEAMVGPQYAPRALQFAMQQAKVDDETSRTLSNLMYRATKNQPPSQTDVQRLNDVTAGAALRNSPFMPAGQSAPPSAAPAPSTAPAPAAAQPAAAPSDAAVSRVRPSDDAIRALIRNPSKTDDFDTMFGKGSAKRALDQWQKMRRATNG